jgi:hypothetical protein
MRVRSIIGGRWARWAGLLFLAAWVPTAAVLFAGRPPWLDARRLTGWVDDLIVPTVLLGAGALLVGRLLNDLLVLAGREPVPRKPDAAAADYDDKPPLG